MLENRENTGIVYFRNWTIFNLKIFNYEDERFLHGDELSVYLNRVAKESNIWGESALFY